MAKPGNYKELKARVVGVNAAAINSAVDGSWLDVAGWDYIVFDFVYTRNAGTAVTWKLSKSSDGGTTVIPYQVATDGGSGVVTYNTYTGTKTTSVSANWDAMVTLKGVEWLRLEDITATSGNSSDLITVTARLYKE